MSMDVDLTRDPIQGLTEDFRIVVALTSLARHFFFSATPKFLSDKPNFRLFVELVVVPVEFRYCVGKFK